LVVRLDDEVRVVVLDGELDDAKRLSARAVNRALAVRGVVWGDRDHARGAQRGRLRADEREEARHANPIGHRCVLVGAVVPWVRGARRATGVPCSVRASRTWLGGTGWRRRGLVRLDERPRAPD